MTNGDRTRGEEIIVDDAARGVPDLSPAEEAIASVLEDVEEADRVGHELARRTDHQVAASIDAYLADEEANGVFEALLLDVKHRLLRADGGPRGR